VLGLSGSPAILKSLMVRVVKALCPALCLVVGLLAAPAVPTRAADAGALLDRLATVAGAPSRAALDAALTAYQHAAQTGSVARTGLLTVIDYTRPSTEPRLWVIDLTMGRILYRELVAHGRGSGENITRTFSNLPGSLMSSMGLFVTDAPYVGRNGYSLRLRGLEPGVNDRAYDRAIVMHGADYVSQSLAARLGRIGRSFGCPAVRSAVARPLIDTIKNGTVLYAYGGVVTDAAAHSPAS
jgi:hypothetical protein